MNQFPAEVYNLIVNAVTSNSDLKNIRLVSRTVSAPATRNLFSRIHVTLPDLPDQESGNRTLPMSYHAQMSKRNRMLSQKPACNHLNDILVSPTLVKEVRFLQYITSLDPNKTLGDYRNNEKASVFTDEMKDFIGHANRFPKLSDLAVEFSCVCAFIAANDWTTMRPEESITFRTNVLVTLLAAVNDPEHPMMNLKSISLKNIQNFNDKSVVNSENFSQLLSRISELRLRIVIQREEASPESSWSHRTMYTFMTELPSVWLQPAQENLTSLTLHMDDYWGYIPKSDFRSLHFPNFKKLALGNYTFSHDWQLDWIISHQTLEELILDDCPIVPRMRNFGTVDLEGYFVAPTAPLRQMTVWRYDGRWVEYFRRMERMERMERLRVLRFGAGQWRDGKNFDGAECVQVGVHGNIYMQFDRGIGPTPWQNWTGWDDESEEEDEESDGGDGEEDIEESITAPFEAEEIADTVAYETLMATLAKR